MGYHDTLLHIIFVFLLQNKIYGVSFACVLISSRGDIRQKNATLTKKREQLNFFGMLLDIKVKSPNQVTKSSVFDLPGYHSAALDRQERKLEQCL